MPLIHVTLARAYSPEVKLRLLEEISRVTHEVTGTPMAGIRAWVVEVPSHDFMIAGKTMAELDASADARDGDNGLL